MDEKKLIDRTTGTELTPGEPDTCKGNPNCCDECDYLMSCAALWEKEKQG